MTSNESAPESSERWRNMRDQEGNLIPKPIDYVGAGTNALLIEDDKVLLQKRSDNGLWGLPGGGMDAGESMAECAVREMWEETGIETRVTRLIGVYSDPAHHSIMSYKSRSGNGEVRIVQYVIGLYAVERTGGEIAVSHESTAVEWHPVNELPEPISPAARLRISDSLTGQVEAFIR